MRMDIQINDNDEMLGSRERAIRILREVASELDNTPRAGVYLAQAPIRDRNENVIGFWQWSGEETP